MMMKYPRVMKKAQSEIDRVVGGDQLPSLDDRDNLPYIECILKETYRCVRRVVRQYCIITEYALPQD